MSDNNIVNLFSRFHDQQEAKLRALTEGKSLKSGGGGGTFDGMETRVKSLEDDMKEIKGDLKTLLKDVAEMKGMLRSMPSAESFGHLKGRVDSLPTTAKVATIISIAVGLMTLVTRWQDVISFFRPHV
ncbi:hypothetical protein [Rhizobiales bacterium]|uniref:hypothetical protein n=1 Tax=Agrobacterium sp. M50-1 TaxID=3132821 RepID=UPI000DD3248E